jgi:hypothetical protein
VTTDGRDDVPGDPGGQPGHRQDEDAVWRAIVENYGDEPKVEDFDAPTQDDRWSSDGRWSCLSRPPEADEDGYTPPPPPPVPRPVGLRLLAWLGLFGVPVLVMILLMTGISLPSWGGVLCLAWFVGGFVYLIATMTNRTGGGGDDWDDGARI